MAVIKTTFKFRRGLLAEWQRINPILAEGEPGWATDAHILKIGDGKTRWNDLNSISNNEISDSAIQAAIEKYLQDNPIDTSSNYYEVLPDSIDDNVYKSLDEIVNAYNGDIAVVKKDYNDLTAYVYYDGWKALSGNYNADNVYFDEDLITSFDMGNIKTSNGMATIAAAGKNLNEVWESIYVKEINTDLKKTTPSCSMSGNSIKYYLVGAESETQTITLSLNKGAYDYGYGYIASKDEADPAEGAMAAIRVTNDGTGVVSTHNNPYSLSWNNKTVTPTTNNGNTFICEAVIQNTAPVDMKCSGTAQYENAGNPTSNLGKIYASQAYPNGTTAANTQTLARWYYPIYSGFTYTDGTEGAAVVESPATVSAERVQQLTATTGANAYNKIKVSGATAEKAWRQYFYAFPSSYNWIMSNAKDSNNIDCQIRKSAQITMMFNGIKVPYDVFYINNAADYGTKSISWTI